MVPSSLLGRQVQPLVHCTSAVPMCYAAGWGGVAGRLLCVQGSWQVQPLVRLRCAYSAPWGGVQGGRLHYYVQLQEPALSCPAAGAGGSISSQCEAPKQTTHTHAHTDLCTAHLVAFEVCQPQHDLLMGWGGVKRPRVKL